MNKEILVKVKSLYNALVDMLHNPSLHISLIRAVPRMAEINPDKIIMMDSLKFMMHIANADGEISQREVNIINYITDTYLTVENLENLIDEDFLDDIDEIPFSIKLFCELENLLYRSGAASDFDSSILNILITYFSGLGVLISEADGYNSRLERIEIDHYLNAIKEYASDNTLSPFFEF